MAATLKVHKWHTRYVCVKLVKGLHEPYQALPNASMGNGTIKFAWEYRYSTQPASRLGTALTTYRGHSTWTILQWFSSTPMLYLVLYAILLEQHYSWHVHPQLEA